MTRRVAAGAGRATLLLLVTTSCARAPAPVVPPSPLAAPRVEVEPPALDPDWEAAPLEAPAARDERDAILDSRWALDARILERAAYWRQIYTRRDLEGFALYLERMGAYAPLVDSTLAAEGLPRSLRYLPIVESGYSTRAVSRAAAVGLWQFMAPVARGFGMQVTPLVDERRDPVKSTLAAARYLKELEERFGSWFLALAAYNGGPYRVERLLAEHAPLAPPGDSLFLVLAPHLPRETREFVPKLMAAAQVAEDPVRFGVDVGEARRPYVFDEVEVPDATSLDVVARAAGVEESVVRELNPHLLRALTPKGVVTRLRLPPGTGEPFAEAFARIPPDERVSVLEHVVARGETLSGIALSYGIRTDELQAANPGARPRRLQIGQSLLVPRGPGQRRSTRTASTSGPPADGGVHVVRTGESLWAIARRYRTTVRTLRSLNGLREGVVLQPGDRLRVAPGAG
jgi:membrane-bound lytic murein transglycosylase D